MIQREPIELLDPELRGNLAAIGIRKGNPFNPSEHMKTLLTEGEPCSAKTVWVCCRCWVVVVVVMVGRTGRGPHDPEEIPFLGMRTF